MYGVWSQLQANVGQTSQDTWVGYTIISSEIWNASEPAVISSLGDSHTEGDRAEVETLGESPDVSESKEGEGTEASLRSRREKDGESESIGIE